MPNCKVYISNINRDTTDSQLRTKFQQFGPITSFLLKRKMNNVTYAFIQYERAEQAAAAIRALDQTTFQERTIKVEPGRGGRYGAEHYKSVRRDYTSSYSSSRSGSPSKSHSRSERRRKSQYVAYATNRHSHERYEAEPASIKDRKYWRKSLSSSKSYSPRKEIVKVQHRAEYKRDHQKNYQRSDNQGQFKKQYQTKYIHEQKDYCKNDRGDYREYRPLHTNESRKEYYRNQYKSDNKNDYKDDYKDQHKNQYKNSYNGNYKDDRNYSKNPIRTSYKVSYKEDNRESYERYKEAQYHRRKREDERDEYKRDSREDSYKRDSYKRDLYKRDQYRRDSYRRDSHKRDSYQRDSYPKDSYMREKNYRQRSPSSDSYSSRNAPRLDKREYRPRSPDPLNKVHYKKLQNDYRH